MRGTRPIDYAYSAQRASNTLRLAWLADNKGSSGGGGGGSGTVTVVSETANWSITAGQSGDVFDNNGAAGTITGTLPAWAAGLNYGFAVPAAFTVIALANGTDKIGLYGTLYGSLTSGAQYDFLWLLAINTPGLWVVRSIVGAWSGA